ELGASVGQHGDLTLGAGVLGPLAQHEDVVHRRAGDHIKALVLELLGVGDIAGHVLFVARRSVGAGNRKQGHFLAAENFARRYRLRPFWAHDGERCFGQPIANLDRHDALRKLLTAYLKLAPRETLYALLDSSKSDLT